MTKKIIGLFQLITGIFGVVIILANLFSKGFNLNSTSVILPQILAGVVLFGLLGWAGYGLLNKTRNAVRYSRILQALQIISFSLGGSMYKFTAAAFIVFGIKNGKFTYGIGDKIVDFTIGNVSNNDTFVVFYVVPIIILWGLINIKEN